MSKGRAVLVGVNLDTCEVNGVTGFDGPMAAVRAHRLMDGIKDDWPDYQHVVLADDRAREVLGDYRTSIIFGTEFEEPTS